MKTPCKSLKKNFPRKHEIRYANQLRLLCIKTFAFEFSADTQKLLLLLPKINLLSWRISNVHSHRSTDFTLSTRFSRALSCAQSLSSPARRRASNAVDGISSKRREENTRVCICTQCAVSEGTFALSSSEDFLKRRARVARGPVKWDISTRRERERDASEW